MKGLQCSEFLPHIVVTSLKWFQNCIQGGQVENGTSCYGAGVFCVTWDGEDL